MNIQQFYRKTASISLSVSLAALIPSFFLIIYGIMLAGDGRYVLVVLPFLIYSFFCYQHYIVCDRRSKSFTENQQENKNMNHTLTKADDILLHFLPAPSLRLLFFSNEGHLLGELRERKILSFKWFLPRFLDKLFERKYGLYDGSNNLIANFTLYKRQIAIMDKDRNLINIIEELGERRMKSIFESNGEEIVVSRTLLYMDYQFFHHQKMISRLQKGLMPFEWENKIKDPNTPVLSFEKSLSDEQKINIFAILAKILY
ncbi:hypothetical protein [Cytobacillus praedii]|uniref:hypothetical protein n=1 Tax=Cytobacillus praedii TaxID=1742358 RepID=UPI003AF449EC